MIKKLYRYHFFLSPHSPRHRLPLSFLSPRSPPLVQDFDNVELSLGLSLNGRFGVDPKAKVETEDEWRKRMELQSLRRMEAKRKRSEK
ncbi:putative ethylene-responsive binding factor-associated repression, Ninja family [Rosa chinensis]|uniref:Ninja-family protein n=1 Tax=Rosa chinensis TaxID=74649 RepID=A0A2P6QRF6_ROSCH|nr:putative ethylene-responsive binding factor-associated repression, Ninja family [Rosa chinensis]